jgi:hypothetical protein
MQGADFTEAFGPGDAQQQSNALQDEFIGSLLSVQREALAQMKNMELAKLEIVDDGMVAGGGELPAGQTIINRDGNGRAIKVSAPGNVVATIERDKSGIPTKISIREPNPEKENSTKTIDFVKGQDGIFREKTTGKKYSVFADDDGNITYGVRGSLSDWQTTYKNNGDLENFHYVKGDAAILGSSEWVTTSHGRNADGSIDREPKKVTLHHYDNFGGTTTDRVFTKSPVKAGLYTDMSGNCYQPVRDSWGNIIDMKGIGEA